MKKLLFVLALGAFAACGSGETTENAVDSAAAVVDTAAAVVAPVVDSAAAVVAPVVDSAVSK